MAVRWPTGLLTKHQKSAKHKPKAQYDRDFKAVRMHGVRSSTLRRNGNIYANGYGTTYSYHPDNRLATRTWARGITTDYTYDNLGQLTDIQYSDTTPNISFEYDRMGYLESVTDASGTHTLNHNIDGQTVYNQIAFSDRAYALTELIDQYGRSAGYTLTNILPNTPQELCSIDITYNELGQVKDVGTSSLANKFKYSYLVGNDLISTLEMPNGVIRTTQFAANYDMPASTTHSNTLNEILVERTFSYDENKQLTAREQYPKGDSVNRTDNFSYNQRKEVMTAVIGTNNYGFDFDSIGNRLSATENTLVTEYQANELNQYTNILYSSLPSSEFTPEFDLDGNQTLIKTITGIWHVTYSAENRPVCFSNATSVVEMGYDYQGRRFEYVEMVNEVPIRHERYLYRGYLQVTALNLLDSTNVVHTIVWDPTEPVATRPLLLQTPSDWFTYSFDQVKNVTELFDSNGAIAATYDYSPFGRLTETSGSAISLNPLTFSSEISDTTLGLIYYNYRHYNPLDGCFFVRDPIEEQGDLNLYGFTNNNGVNKWDKLGLYTISRCTIEIIIGHNTKADNQRWGWTPKAIKTDNCSAVSVHSCYSENININGQPNPEGIIGEVRTIDAIQSVLASFENTEYLVNTICSATDAKGKPCCCKKVTVRISCKFGFDLMTRYSIPAGVCGKTKTLECKRK